ncbi:MAG: PIG-L family deacetylase, partial [Bacteroidia bacterium]|nr:PIG-L family deacetylase [Bacteroidia bacterium]
MLRNLFLFLILPLFCTTLNAQLNSGSSSELLLQIQKLNVLGKVLYIAAHPDDENTRLLAYLANEKKFRTAYLSITRGDGGQNLIGKEQGPALGVLRTQELLAARNIDKAEQFFTRAVDFGYSKNPEETFSFWNKNNTLADVVYLIRTFQPDVIICRFPTTGEGGHGHHTASAILAQEAFDAAADSTKFPEQLKYTTVWKTKRLFWNTFNFGSTNTTAPNQLQMDVGSYNALLGKSYGEIASESRSSHKSQGFGVARQRGKNIEYFKQLKGDSVSKDIFEGISTSWLKFKDTQGIQKTVNECIGKFNAIAPERILPQLQKLHTQLSALKETEKELAYWKTQKLKELESLILSCSGLWLEASAPDFRGVPGQEITIQTQIINRSKTAVTLKGIRYLNQSDTTTQLSLEYNTLYTFKRKEVLPATTVYSSPYWLNADSYSNSTEPFPGLAQAVSNTIVHFDLKLGEFNLKVARDVIYKSTDPVKGEVYRPFEILPPLTVNLSEKAVVFTNAAPKKVVFTLKANTSNLSGKLMLQLSEGWTCDSNIREFSLAKAGDELMVEARISGNAQVKEGYLKAAVLLNSKEYNQSIYRIEYDHVPYQFMLSPAETKLVNLDVKTKKLRIAYIEGAGDDIPAALKQMDFEVSTLNDEQINTSDLNQYHAIVTGVRAYNANKNMPRH